MSAPTDIQIIRKNGRPAFVVIAYDDYLKAFPSAPHIPANGNLPDPVVWLTIEKGYSLTRAWREHLGLSQLEVAKRMGISQAAYSQMERPAARPRKATLAKIATALCIEIRQLRPRQRAMKKIKPNRWDAADSLERD